MRDANQYFRPRAVPSVRAEQWTGITKRVIAYQGAWCTPASLQVHAGDWIVYAERNGSERVVDVLSDADFHAAYEPVGSDEPVVESRRNAVFIKPSPMGGVSRS